jgi:hypothetical protein
MSRKKMKASEFDSRFDAGESLVDLGVDLEVATKPVNVDLPIWAIKELDKEATRRGIARQALIKSWLVDQIDFLKSKGEKAG